MDGDSATVDHPPVVEVDRVPVDWDLVDRVEERRPDRLLVRRRRLAPQHDVETDLELGERRQRGGSAAREPRGSPARSRSAAASRRAAQRRPTSSRAPTAAASPKSTATSTRAPAASADGATHARWSQPTIVAGTRSPRAQPVCVHPVGAGPKAHQFRSPRRAQARRANGDALAARRERRRRRDAFVTGGSKTAKAASWCICCPLSWTERGCAHETVVRLEVRLVAVVDGKAGAVHTKASSRRRRRRRPWSPQICTRARARAVQRDTSGAERDARAAGARPGARPDGPRRRWRRRRTRRALRRTTPQTAGR